MSSPLRQLKAAPNKTCTVPIMKDDKIWAFIDEAFRNLAYAEKALIDRPSGFAQRHVEKAAADCERYVAQWRSSFGDAPIGIPRAQGLFDGLGPVIALEASGPHQ